MGANLAIPPWNSSPGRDPLAIRRTLIFLYFPFRIIFSLFTYTLSLFFQVDRLQVPIMFCLMFWLFLVFCAQYSFLSFISVFRSLPTFHGDYRLTYRHAHTHTETNRLKCYFWIQGTSKCVTPSKNSISKIWPQSNIFFTIRG